MQRLEWGVKENRVTWFGLFILWWKIENVNLWKQRDHMEPREGANGRREVRTSWPGKEAITASGDLQEVLSSPGGECFEGLCVRLDPKIAGHLSEKDARDCWCLGFIQKPAWGAWQAGGLMGCAWSHADGWVLWRQEAPSAHQTAYKKSGLTKQTI